MRRHVLLHAILAATLAGLAAHAGPPPQQKPGGRAQNAAAKEAAAVAPAPERPVTDAGTAETGRPAADAATERRTALTGRLVLKVVHPEQARQALVDAARGMGGFPVEVSDDRLVLKVPPDKLSEMMQKVSAEGLVLEKTMEREDLTESIAQLEARLRSKREILGRLRSFIDDSGVQATLQIERNMTALVSEMEQVKGELRVAEERARYAVIDVSFTFQRRDRIVYVSSPFEWLNTVDLSRFLEEF